ncbi:PREDICTED: uncharacterized protein LOC108554371 [Eufriesea mexicana]|uniref:uncharacterized protein LOC108554371 n=1 Tax=Eufriesea mexicana TaxID=516756 RepID=UPI00083BB866|nr:PREDICTED: uncharacterized protein LOC108554371 [Eufriesea mexicana]
MTYAELRKAEQVIVKCIPQRAYRNELLAMSAGRPTTTLTLLDPFTDKEGILRVGGRLTKGSLKPDMKHPMILPRNDHVTQLVIRGHQIKSLRAGVQTTLNSVRQRFWIPGRRYHNRKTIHQCVRCIPAKPSTINYKMSNLSPSRITPSRPFLHSGIDYCDAFHMKVE